MPYGNIGKVESFERGTERQLALCDLFTVNRLAINGTKFIEISNNPVSR